jgi:GDP-L-fucose synthase
MKLLLTGANGFIARNLKEYFLLDNIEITLLNRKIADLTNRHQVNDFFKNNYFDAIIHCASVGGNRNIKDYHSCLNTNLSMFYNLIENQDKFDKFINLGSGAELDRDKDINSSSNLYTSFPLDDYGMSKNIIAKIGMQILNFYNIRIFNVFNYDELDTRMIKGNIKNYIARKDITIHQDKHMDFFYLEDLYVIIKNVIFSSNCPKNLDCCYSKNYKLSDIANKINDMSEYKVNIIIENEARGNDYLGNPTALYLTKFSNDLKGLDLGLKETYERLVNL